MWPNPQFPADLVKFTEEIFNEKRHFLCSVDFVAVAGLLSLKGASLYVTW